METSFFVTSLYWCFTLAFPTSAVNRNVSGLENWCKNLTFRIFREKSNVIFNVVVGCWSLPNNRRVGDLSSKLKLFSSSISLPQNQRNRLVSYRDRKVLLCSLISNFFCIFNLFPYDRRILFLDNLKKQSP